MNSIWSYRQQLCQGQFFCRASQRNEKFCRAQKIQALLEHSISFQPYCLHLCEKSADLQRRSGTIVAQTALLNGALRLTVECGVRDIAN
jgi:hypothetical protein